VLIAHHSCGGMSQHALRKTAYFSSWGSALLLFTFSDIVFTFLKLFCRKEVESELEEYPGEICFLFSRFLREKSIITYLKLDPLLKT